MNVDERSGVFTFDPYGLYVNDGDTVHFNELRSRSFKIVFHGDTPLKKTKISHTDPDSDLKARVKPGVYTYAVAILGSRGELFLEADCPSIIVH